MRILVTNDDGFDADGLAVLVSYLERMNNMPGIAEPWEITVLAPESERSGVSHAMTLKRPTKVRKLSENRYTCSGTPADCLIVAGLGVVSEKPDVVISGINRGPNLGTDIIYSGTCGAARQAALEGIPAIAVSCAEYKSPLHYEACAAFVAKNLTALVAAWQPDTFININGPSSSEENLEAIWAVPGRNRYIDQLKCFDGADGYTYCFLTEGRHERTPDPISDHHAVMNGKIAISLIAVHPVSAHDSALNGKPFQPQSDF